MPTRALDIKSAALRPEYVSDVIRRNKPIPSTMKLMKGWTIPFHHHFILARIEVLVRSKYELTHNLASSKI